MILLHNTILVKPIIEEKKGSILLLTSDQKRQCKGKIVLVGEKCTDERFYVGKAVLYHEHSGTNLPYKGEDDLLVLKVGDENMKGEVIAIL